MGDTKQLAACLEDAVTNCHSKGARTALETLLNIHRNILYNKDEHKYRIIRTTNPTFCEKIWSLYKFRTFLYLCGWREIDGSLVFNSDEKLLTIIDVLLEHREIVPSAFEWDSLTKYEGKSAEQLKEEELRRKAAIERQKELDEFMKDKKYREELSATVKAEIAADKYRRRQKQYTQPVMGNKLVKGAKIRTLNSGCNRNQ